MLKAISSKSSDERRKEKIARRAIKNHPTTLLFALQEYAAGEIALADIDALIQDLIKLEEKYPVIEPDGAA